MSLSSQLLDELRARIGQSGQRVLVSNGRRTARCEAVHCERFAVTFDELAVETPELATATAAELQAASRDLSARVNYLLEPIAPIETDAAGCSVQMRSNPPQKDDNGWRYYELLLQRGGSVALARYEKRPGQPRVRVPAILTHEVVGRLIDDFLATVDAI
ncbi:MAG: hypothetical protein DCC67_05125 [Planctomycetota bacterium]|nr:MAG: hypothetical protein DCC67_05125 [Planctomycetota bacterium]